MPDQSDEKIALWLQGLNAFDGTRIISRNTEALISMLGIDPINIQKASQLLANEPALSAKLMMMANSSFFGFSRQIKSIDEAVVILGATRVKILVYTSLLLQETVSKHAINFVKHSLTTALFCRAIARQVGSDPDIAYLTGLFHVLPIVIHYDPYVAMYLSTPLLKRAAHIVFDKIKLPEEIPDAILSLYDDQPILPTGAVLRLGFNLTVIQLGQDFPFNQLLNSETDFRRLGTTPESVVELMPTVAEEQAFIFELIG